MRSSAERFFFFFVFDAIITAERVAVFGAARFFAHVANSFAGHHGIAVAFKSLVNSGHIDVVGVFAGTLVQQGRRVARARLLERSACRGIWTTLAKGQCGNEGECEDLGHLGTSK